MNLRTRIKFCGITSVEEVRAAVAAGADAIGLVFYPGSPRYLPITQARTIAEAVPAMVTVTGLFVDPSVDQVVEHLQGLRLDLLQFHGDENATFCAGFDRPYMKAIRVKAGLDIPAAVTAFPDAAAILLDAWDEGAPGGTGRVFDWQVVQEAVSRDRLVLAGGLNPDNVGAAIRQLSPYAVDVSSGIEETPGRKSVRRMQQFALAVQNARSNSSEEQTS